jgi:hypothetical protein
MDRIFDAVQWKPCEANDRGDSDLPFATHTGKLHIGDRVLDVVQLNTGQRLITEESLNRFFGIAAGDDTAS